LNIYDKLAVIIGEVVMDEQGVPWQDRRDLLVEACERQDVTSELVELLSWFNGEIPE
jgi:hypothetical protein